MLRARLGTTILRNTSPAAVTCSEADALRFLFSSRDVGCLLYSICDLMDNNNLKGLFCLEGDKNNIIKRNDGIEVALLNSIHMRSLHIVVCSFMFVGTAMNQIEIPNVSYIYIT